MQNQSSEKLRQKSTEVEAMRTFFANKGEVLDSKRVCLYSSEPVDTEYGGLKFQIVKADFDFQEMLGRAKQQKSGFIGSRKRTRSQVWEDFVLRPLRKKNKYGKSAKGIILLIHSYTEPPWVEDDLKIARELDTFISQIKTYCFDEVYLVLPNKNIRIYPR